MTRDVPHLSLSEEAYVGESESGKNRVSGRTGTSMRKDTKMRHSCQPVDTALRVKFLSVGKINAFRDPVLFHKEDLVNKDLSRNGKPNEEQTTGKPLSIQANPVDSHLLSTMRKHGDPPPEHVVQSHVNRPTLVQLIRDRGRRIERVGVCRKQTGS